MYYNFWKKSYPKTWSKGWLSEIICGQINFETVLILDRSSRAKHRKLCSEKYNTVFKVYLWWSQVDHFSVRLLLHITQIDTDIL